jgi:hypothetical protein
LEQKHKQKIEELMEELECPRDFVCYKQHPEHILKAQVYSDHMFGLPCSQKGDLYREFLFSYGHSRYCQCPTVFHIAKKLNE